MPLTQSQVERLGHITPDEVTVYLDGHGIDTMFFCYKCRKPIMKHRQRVMAIYEGNVELLDVYSMPIMVKCNNINCGTIYHFRSMV